MRRKFPIYLARIRMPLTVAGILLCVIPGWYQLGWLVLAGIVMIVIGVGTSFLPLGYVRRDPIQVSPPVQGDWIPVNSPADKVPSHGTHGYGQAYAVDLVHTPTDGTPWKGVHRWPPARRPEEFPSFGRPVLAPADGVVVRVHQRERDHWSRNSWPGLVYVLVEGMLRELTGPSRILGNHVILDLGDGVYAAMAHLRRKSVRVRKGQRVTAGEQLAECGNSGNSSEPHLHFQLMDHPSVLVAAGLPFAFDRYEIGGATVEGDVPGGQQTFTMTPPVPAETG
ncbi:M23 family metallopeptidase [Actinomadura alba]|uniref:M23 family metallopeptidase n=1 Tax=Actinomadura alba TaxID=406431 RepID=A0ABR7LS99_9ACTN|nr:M23 family metallopeptidase [Actinomadura alba]MBC6467719.1 M23 family metallopeptidase [Actinomadura alba]